MRESAMAELPEAALAAADHVLGDADAKLTLLEYGDYECPACIQAEPLMQHLVDTHRGRLRFVFRHFPLVEVHPNAELAAEAAEAAAAQGQFWPMHHLLFAQTHHLTPAALVGYAQSLGLDMNRFNAEMGDRIYTQRIQEHRRAGERSGLRATPAFFLNGKAVDVSFGFEKLDEAVQAALKLA
jgi:protein-disulfide isomerase